jgi:hypothetical protein
MSVISLRQWNHKPHESRNFSIETKLTTLGTVDTTKTITGYFISIRQNTLNTNLSPAFFQFELLYRTSMNYEYTSLGSINNILGDLYTQTDKSFEKIIKFTKPIEGVKQVQLKLVSSLLQGDVNVNDFGIMYRTVRDSSTNKHDDD